MKGKFPEGGGGGTIEYEVESMACRVSKLKGRFVENCSEEKSWER